MHRLDFPLGIASCLSASVLPEVKGESDDSTGTAGTFVSFGIIIAVRLGVVSAKLHHKWPQLG